MRRAALAALAVLPAAPGAARAERPGDSFLQPLALGTNAILESARSARIGQRRPPTPRPAPEPSFAAQQVRFIPLAESEIRACPAAAERLSSEPDPGLYSYIGFRYVRSDGTTCSPAPTGRIHYQEPGSRTLTYQTRSPGDSTSFSYEPVSREYVVRRNFYFRTQPDGTRRFHSYDARGATGREITESVGVSFTNRARFPLLPWEAPESFRLDYGLPDGARLEPGVSSYEYDARRETSRDAQGRLRTSFTLTALRKRRLTPPEKEVVALELLSRGGRLLLKVTDSRAPYYPGERLGLKIKLWRHVFLLGDKVAYDFDIVLETAGETVLDPADPRWDAFRKEPLQGGKEYYAQWSFRRADSRVSTGEWVDRPRTDRFRNLAARDF